MSHLLSLRLLPPAGVQENLSSLVEEEAMREVGDGEEGGVEEVGRR